MFYVVLEVKPASKYLGCLHTRQISYPLDYFLGHSLNLHEKRVFSKL